MEREIMENGVADIIEKESKLSMRPNRQELFRLYQVISIFMFVSFYTVIPNEINSVLLIVMIGAGFLDVYFAERYYPVTVWDRVLRLFSVRYFSCMPAIFLMIEKYYLLPLLLILAKEMFMLRFGSVSLGDGRPLIVTDRIFESITSGILLLMVLFHINNVFIGLITPVVSLLGLLSFLYLFYKIFSNMSGLKEVFKSEINVELKNF